MVKISYKKEWGEHDGTVYNQTINTDTKQFNKIKKYLQSINKNEIKNSYFKLYFKTLEETPKQETTNGVKYYLNLTQLFYINLFLNNKRILDRNTIFKLSY